MDKQPENSSVDPKAAHVGATDGKALARQSASSDAREPRSHNALVPAPYIAADMRGEAASATKSRWRMSSNLPLYTAALCIALGVGGVVGGHIASQAEAPDTTAQAETTKIDRALPWKREVATLQTQANAKVRDDLKAMRNEIAALRASNDQLRQSEGQRQTQELRGLRAALEAQKSETASLKADLAARLDRADRDANQRTDKTVERVDRLEKRLADPIVTGSVPKSADHGKSDAGKTDVSKVERPPVRGIVLRDVDRGVALIETRRGLMEVMPGDTIPTAGRVEAIEKHAGRWRVVTTTGIIDDKPD